MATLRPIARHLFSNIPIGFRRPVCRISRLSPVLLPTNRRSFSSNYPLQDTTSSKPQNESSKSTPPNPESRRGKNRKRNLALLALTLLALNALLYNRPPSQTTIFEPPRFTPFTIVKREITSPTSIILTLRPNISELQSLKDPFKESWERGTWSIEIKQPDLQIARAYTPLPPAHGDGDGYLRLYIRKEHKGEVSGYLHALPVGSKVECRGPHAGVDLDGGVREVLFLAGGTGIAPGLQVAHTLLERRKHEPVQAKVRIIWANRRKDECVGRELEMGDNPGFIEGRRMGLIVRQIKELQKAFPGQIEVEYLVDEEGTLLDRRKVSDLVRLSDAPNVVDDSKLLFVSGPEGFVNFIAGPKIWEGGKEGQGEVSGILGQLGLRHWKIWKL